MQYSQSKFYMRSTHAQTPVGPVSVSARSRLDRPVCATASSLATAVAAWITLHDEQSVSAFDPEEKKWPGYNNEGRVRGSNLRKKSAHPRQTDDHLPRIDTSFPIVVMSHP